MIQAKQPYLLLVLSHLSPNVPRISQFLKIPLFCLTNCNFPFATVPSPCCMNTLPTILYLLTLFPGSVFFFIAFNKFTTTTMKAEDSFCNYEYVHGPKSAAYVIYFKIYRIPCLLIKRAIAFGICALFLF